MAMSADAAPAPGPDCGLPPVSVQRVARRGFYERLILPLMLRRAYRCRGCSERFYDRKS